MSCEVSRVFLSEWRYFKKHLLFQTKTFIESCECEAHDEQLWSGCTGKPEFTGTSAEALPSQQLVLGDSLIVKLCQLEQQLA